jgi:hypothetical protein
VLKGRKLVFVNPRPRRRAHPTAAGAAAGRPCSPSPALDSDNPATALLTAPLAFLNAGTESPWFDGGPGDAPAVWSDPAHRSLPNLEGVRTAELTAELLVTLDGFASGIDVGPCFGDAGLRQWRVWDDTEAEVTPAMQRSGVADTSQA